MEHCLFCNIINRKAPANIIYEDDLALVFKDIHPQAPEHLLVIPKKHIASLNQAGREDANLLGHLLLVGTKVAKEAGMADAGFRTVINTNAQAGQTVFHIHVHILGGRIMRWPPG